MYVYREDKGRGEGSEGERERKREREREREREDCMYMYIEYYTQDHYMCAVGINRNSNSCIAYLPCQEL